MSAKPDTIIRSTGITRTIFVISLIVVGVAGGVVGYFAPPLFKQSTSLITLNGSGSTFVQPLLNAMNTNYTGSNPGVQINYQGVGSGAGISNLNKSLTDFAATDAPLTPSQTTGITNHLGAPLTIPESIGAVAIAYNINKNIGSGSLKLNATVTAMIFQGNITYWDDPNIVSLQDSAVRAALPHAVITVVHRAESSGTSFIFTSWLSTGKPNFPWKLGALKSPNWAGGSATYIAINGNPGVASDVQLNPNTIGYVELNYILSTPGLNSATVLTGDPKGIGGPVYVAPTLLTSAYAVNNSTSSLPQGNGDWSQVSLLNSKGNSSYPIVSFTYILVFKELSVLSSMTQARAQALVNYLWFVVHDGQNQAISLAYVKLPSSVVAIDDATIRSITFNGTTLHS